MVPQILERLRKKHVALVLRHCTKKALDVVDLTELVFAANKLHERKRVLSLDHEVLDRRSTAALAITNEPKAHGRVRTVLIKVSHNPTITARVWPLHFYILRFASDII